MIAQSTYSHSQNRPKLQNTKFFIYGVEMLVKSVETLKKRIVHDVLFCKENKQNEKQRNTFIEQLFEAYNFIFGPKRFIYSKGP